MIWVVDDGPFGDLALALDPAWTWPTGTLHVVEAVAAAAALDRSGRRTRLLAMSGAGGPAVVQHAVREGTAASDFLWRHLRARETDAADNLGEHESIAWILHEAPPDAVFVAGDKRALFLALSELGPPRVATAFDLWLDLHRHKLISTEKARALLARTASAQGVPVPARAAM